MRENSSQYDDNRILLLLDVVKRVGAGSLLAVMLGVFCLAVPVPVAPAHAQTPISSACSQIAMMLLGRVAASTPVHTLVRGGQFLADELVRVRLTQNPAGDRYTTLVVPAGVEAVSSTDLTGDDVIEFRIVTSGNHTVTLTGKTNFIPVAVALDMPTCVPGGISGGGDMTAGQPSAPEDALQAGRALDAELAKATQVEAAIVAARALRGYPRRMDALSRLIFPPQPEQSFDSREIPTPKPSTGNPTGARGLGGSANYISASHASSQANDSLTATRPYWQSPTGRLFRPRTRLSSDLAPVLGRAASALQDVANRGLMYRGHPVRLLLDVHGRLLLDRRGGDTNLGDGLGFSIGGLYQVTNRIAVGGLLGYDAATSSSPVLGVGRNLTSNGLMIGPLVSGKLKRSLIGSLQVGLHRFSHQARDRNGLSQDMESSGYFVMGSLSGYSKFDRWDIRPRIGVRYIRHDIEALAFVSGGGAASQSLAHGELELAVRAEYPLRTASFFPGYTIVPFAEITAMWAFARPPDNGIGGAERYRETGLDGEIAGGAIFYSDGMLRGRFRFGVAELLESDLLQLNVDAKVGIVF